MSHPILERRRAEQRDRIAMAAAWAARLAERMAIDAAVVFGSIARGDFNKWSDLDVLVIAPVLPQSARERLELLMADTPPGLQPVAWTPAELADRRVRRDPIARECEELGVVVWGTLPGPSAR